MFGGFDSSDPERLDDLEGLIARIKEMMSVEKVTDGVTIKVNDPAILGEQTVSKFFDEKGLNGLKGLVDTGFLKQFIPQFTEFKVEKIENGVKLVGDPDAIHEMVTALLDPSFIPGLIEKLTAMFGDLAGSLIGGFFKGLGTDGKG